MSSEFERLWDDAKRAANTAAIAENTKLGDENSRGFDCGFAWVNVPGNTPFGRWLKKAGIASKGYPTGLQIWYGKLHDVPTQSVSVHVAAARAASEHLQRALGTSLISFGSRLD